MTGVPPNSPADDTPAADNRIGDRQQPGGKSGGEAVPCVHVDGATRVTVGQVGNTLIILRNDRMLR
jgi:hypothetical protein